MYPESAPMVASGNVMTETAIDTGLFRDLTFRSASLKRGAWSVRVYYKPLVSWIWGGALLMALGGGLALQRSALSTGRKKATRGP